MLSASFTLKSVLRLRSGLIQISRHPSSSYKIQTSGAVSGRLASTISFSNRCFDNQQKSLLNNHDGRMYGVSPTFRRFTSSEEKKAETDGERKLRKTLSKSFPKATSIIVEDISGGCGSMYQIFVESPEFSGLPMVKQHILVNTALKKEIQEMHGLRITTSVPK